MYTIILLQHPENLYTTRGNEQKKKMKFKQEMKVRQNKWTIEIMLEMKGSKQFIRALKYERAR